MTRGRVGFPAWGGGDEKRVFLHQDPKTKQCIILYISLYIYICVYYTEILNFRLYYTKKCWLFCLDFLVNFKTASSELEVT